MSFRSLVIAGTLSCLHSICIVAQSGDVNGLWVGQIKGEVVVDMVFRISSEGDDRTCYLDIPTYNVEDVPSDVVEVTEDSLRVHWSIGAGFKGAFGSDGEVTGTWIQPAGNMPLTLRKSDAYRRIQEPDKPYPYLEQSIEISLDSDPVTTLSGTLTTPENRTSFPVVVLLSPAGMQDRDGKMHAHRPMLVLADRLTRGGIGVFRMDDRGVGSSGGDYNDMTLELQARDTRAAIEHLRRQFGSAISSLGVAGFGEGGSAALILSSEVPLDFLILMGTAGVANEDLLLAKSLKQLQAAGASPEDIARDTAYARNIYKIIGSKSVQLDTTALRTLATDYHSASPLLRSRFPDPQAFYQSQVNMVSIPWFKSYATFQPAPYLDEIKCPTLAIFGSIDQEVDPTKNAKALDNHLASAPAKDFTVEIVPGVNHLFQPSTSGIPEEYSMLATTFDETTMARIVGWILGVTE